MAAAKESARRSCAVVSNLKLTVEEEKKKLVTSLEGKVLGVYARCISTSWMTPTDLCSSTERENEFADTIIKFLLYAQQDQTGLYERAIKQFSTSKPKVSAIYRKAKFNITSSRELLGHYERASQQVTFPERLPMGDSGGEEDNQTLQRVLDRQREKIKLEVHQLLNRGPKLSKELAEGDLLKLDTYLWDHFAMAEKASKEHVEALDGRKGETWAVVANNAQRGVRRAVKDLPEDVE